MSKAFTRDDDDAGFTLAAARSRAHAGPVTPLGARLARERLSVVAEKLEQAGVEERAVLEVERERVAAVAAAPVRPLPAHEDAVAFGAEVRVRDATGREREVVVASPDEIGIVPHAASATSPIARALLNARPGDVVEFDGPRGHDELTVVAVRFPR